MSTVCTLICYVHVFMCQLQHGEDCKDTTKTSQSSALPTAASVAAERLMDSYDLWTDSQQSAVSLLLEEDLLVATHSHQSVESYKCKLLYRLTKQYLRRLIDEYMWWLANNILLICTATLCHNHIHCFSITAICQHRHSLWPSTCLLKWFIRLCAKKNIALEADILFISTSTQTCNLLFIEWHIKWTNSRSNWNQMKMSISV